MYRQRDRERSFPRIEQPLRIEPGAQSSHCLYARSPGHTGTQSVENILQQFQSDQRKLFGRTTVASTSSHGLFPTVQDAAGDILEEQESGQTSAEQQPPPHATQPAFPRLGLVERSETGRQ